MKTYEMAFKCQNAVLLEFRRMYLGFWLSIEVGVGPKTEITEISAEIDFGHINFSAEILNSKYTINQEIFYKFNYSKVFSGLEIMFVSFPMSF